MELVLQICKLNSLKKSCRYPTNMNERKETKVLDYTYATM